MSEGKPTRRAAGLVRPTNYSRYCAGQRFATPQHARAYYEVIRNIHRRGRR